MLQPALRTVLIAVFAASGAGVAAAQTPASGETLFRQRCGSCHTVQPNVHRMGPSLHGVVGRRAAAAQGYRYSAGLSGWGQSWTAANLERYLADPRETVPGTRMSIAPPPAAQRAAIIRYLQTQR
jgi:cytochrome c